MAEFKLPCVDCVAFAICKTAYDEYKVTREPQYIILSNRCRIIKEWLYEESGDIDIRLRRVYILYQYFDSFIMEEIDEKEKDTMP